MIKTYEILKFHPCVIFAIHLYSLKGHTPAKIKENQKFFRIHFFGNQSETQESQRQYNCNHKTNLEKIEPSIVVKRKTKNLETAEIRLFQGFFWLPLQGSDLRHHD